MAQEASTVHATRLDEGAEFLPPKEVRLRARHWEIFHRNILWRVVSSLVSAILVLATLYAFAGMENVNTWERRWFNMLTIFFSSLVSLSVGSLLGFLGGMMRWPLLANRSHSPLGVDLVLGMQNPTGSLRLVANHVSRRHWSVTTTVVLVYLLFNIVGRLSVAIFGLTYDLNEHDAVEYPVMVTDWSSGSWLNASAESFDIQRLVGRITAPIEHGGDWIEASETKTKHNISEQSIDGSVDGQTVTYSYSFKEAKGLEMLRSKERVLRSSVKCVVRQVRNGKIYEHGAGDDKWSAEELKDLTNVQLERRNLTTAKGHLFECEACLAGLDGNSRYGTTLFYGLSANRSHLAASILLNGGALIPTSPISRVTGVGRLSGNYSLKIYGPGDPDYPFYMDGMDEIINMFSGSQLEKSDEAKVREGERRAAQIVARLPMYHIISADMLLPKEPLTVGASPRSYIQRTLEVKWDRAIAVLLAIFVGELLAISVVYYACRKVLVRDHESYLSIARLLMEYLEQPEAKGRSVDTGRELTEQMKHAKLRYKAVRTADGALRVTLLGQDEGAKERLLNQDEGIVGLESEDLLKRETEVGFVDGAYN
ncbi:hypothetical protein QBC34DRAFT_361207 [Podospora aff. communis PSN243]|uniref:Uncharacterized protein n=1 Tax=Podospora aff. communis PSN243 TaxID=3040156 RepID=A0AAV9G6A6_9PEZI|nr:hypothetical protein QBC34DRAFT_361207 [Podospora aff. communis PSN243]